MGHARIGKLPATLKWRHVIGLISGGADVRDVAAATARAAERGLAKASSDPALRHAFWLLTQIPVAARADSFPDALRRLGLLVGEAPTLPEICSAFTTAIDRVLRAGGVRRSDFGEMAQLAAVESLGVIARRETGDLFGSGHEPEDTRAALSRDFFARLTRRCLGYYLSRELPNHVGLSARFHSHAEFRAFEEALDRHCRETALIVRDYAGEWFSKTTYEGGIDPKKAGGFAHVALGKILSELRVRHEAHA